MLNISSWWNTSTFSGFDTSDAITFCISLSDRLVPDTMSLIGNLVKTLTISQIIDQGLLSLINDIKELKYCLVACYALSSLIIKCVCGIYYQKSN